MMTTKPDGLRKPPNTKDRQMEMKWQPIETAPRDGTSVLLGGGYYYCEERNAEIRTAAAAAWHWVAVPENGAWLMAGLEGGYDWLCYRDPTHWMPLPPAPESE